MTFTWKSGAHISADAEAVGSRLMRLRAKHGGNLTAAVVVKDARRPDSPLNPCFEWDDGRAAEKYRLDQARYVLRSVVRVQQEEGGEPKTFRAFVVVSEDDEEHYTATVDAMGNATLRAQILQRAFRELDSWRERYREYEELAAVFEAAEAARQRVA